MFFAVFTVLVSGCEKEDITPEAINPNTGVSYPKPPAGKCADQPYINHLLTFSDRNLWQAGYEQRVYFNGVVRDLGTCSTYANYHQWGVYVSQQKYYSGTTMIDAANVLRQWIAECRCGL